MSWLLPKLFMCVLFCSTALPLTRTLVSADFVHGQDMPDALKNIYGANSPLNQNLKTTSTHKESVLFSRVYTSSHPSPIEVEMGSIPSRPKGEQMGEILGSYGKR